MTKYFSIAYLFNLFPTLGFNVYTLVISLKEVAIIGGGLSGLITAIQLARAQISVCVYEKRNYPFHRVCGEYISNETVPFLKSLDIFPQELSPVSIRQLQLTSTNGKSAMLPLPLGGFGISRFAFDHWLYTKALALGVNFKLNTEISKIDFANGLFKLHSSQNTYSAEVAIGSFGKRSKLDVVLDRPFIKRRSPYVGIKYHIRIDHPDHLIGLHNFENGYCGISKVENGVTNLCYLSHRKNLKTSGNIRAMEEQVLYKNPFLKSIFREADFLFEQPETINEISFETKSPVEHHVLMAGDSAGMITPLCGNGMALAIHASKILAGLVIPFCENDAASYAQLEAAYAGAWRKHFAVRLRAGRLIQHLFGSSWASNVAVHLAMRAKPLAGYLINQTHGKPF